jgi:electron transport complex protein RnfB
VTDVYRRLAKKLDRLPQGFPRTESGVELRILQKIFPPADAETALRLGPIPVTAERIARRLRRPVGETRAMLDRMADRGQIGSFTSHGEQRYALVPFVIGIYEFQVRHVDEEFATLFETYAPSLLKTLGGYGPALGRVVPIHASIDPGLEILGYEDLRVIIRDARSFALRECICRKDQALLGHPCSHTLEACLAFSNEPHAFDYFNYAGRVIPQDEALRVLDVTEEEGLVHATYNVRDHPMFVCNCCECCCGFLRGLKEFGAPHMIARSNFVAAIDPDGCSDCGACASPRCPMDAITHQTGRFAVSADRCIGCGVCAPVCPTDAIRLVRRPEPDQTVPPKDIVHWSVDRLSSRSGPLTRLALRTWLAYQNRGD